MLPRQKQTGELHSQAWSGGFHPMVCQLPLPRLLLPKLLLPPPPERRAEDPVENKQHGEQDKLYEVSGS